MGQNTPRYGYTHIPEQEIVRVGGHGRKPKLSEENIKRICRLIREGNYDTTVLAIMGISQDTWYRWLREGEEIADDETGMYDFIFDDSLPPADGAIARDRETLRLQLQFYVEIVKARAQAEANMLRRINTASQTQWQAAAWFLERKFPERWGREKMNATVKVDLSPYVAALNAKNDDTWDDEDKAQLQAALDAEAEADTDKGTPG